MSTADQHRRRQLVRLDVLWVIRDHALLVANQSRHRGSSSCRLAFLPLHSLLACHPLGHKGVHKSDSSQQIFQFLFLTQEGPLALLIHKFCFPS
jgi:hypothetical protein